MINIIYYYEIVFFILKINTKCLLFNQNFFFSITFIFLFLMIIFMNAYYSILVLTVFENLSGKELFIEAIYFHKFYHSSL